jgi:hypothetical protein
VVALSNENPETEVPGVSAEPVLATQRIADPSVPLFAPVTVKIQPVGAVIFAGTVGM